MASCDDDFSLLADETTVTAPAAPPQAQTPSPSVLRHRHPFAHRSISPVDDNNDVVSPDAEGFSDGGGGFGYSHPKNSTSNTKLSYHVVGVNSYESDQNPFDTDSDQNRAGINDYSLGLVEKREREEVNESGASYPYKRSKGSSSATAAAAAAAGEYRKDREEWSDSAIACFLEAYTEKFMMLNRGNLRGRDWEDVATIVSEICEKQPKSVEQCKNKVDNLKKRYKLERQRLSKGGVSSSQWPWYQQMEQIVGNPSSGKAIADEEKSAGGSANSGRQLKRCVAAATPSAQINNLKSKSNSSTRWQRVVFKISGAALSGTASQNIDPKVAMLIAKEISIACHMGVEVAIVLGGRNFFCGDTWVTTSGLDRCTAYQIGMMATLMNSILLQSALEKLGVQTRLQSAFSMPEAAEPYSRQRAIRHLEKGRVVIFGAIGAGTGNPLFSTDTAAALRASEIHADVVLKGANVDGVIACDPGNNNIVPKHISFRDLTASGASSAMDMMAIRFCEDNGIPVVIFNIHEPGNISRALCGEHVGTLIDQSGRRS